MGSVPMQSYKLRGTIMVSLLEQSMSLFGKMGVQVACYAEDCGWQKFAAVHS